MGESARSTIRGRAERTLERRPTKVQRDFSAEDRERPVGSSSDEGPHAHGFSCWRGTPFPSCRVFSADRERDAKSAGTTMQVGHLDVELDHLAATAAASRRAERAVSSERFDRASFAMARSQPCPIGVAGRAPVE